MIQDPLKSSLYLCYYLYIILPQKDQLKIIVFFALSSMAKKKNVAIEEHSGLDLNNSEKQKLIDFIRDDFQ